MIAAIAGERATLRFHLMRRLPGAQDHLADPAHCLRVGRHHADGAEVVENIFGGDGFAPNARFGKRDILHDLGIEVVAHHQHVEMFVEGVDGVGPRWIG